LNKATKPRRAWVGAEDCGDREACRDAIRQRVAAYFQRYDVTFVTRRPPAGSPYTMIVVAPPNEECTFGERGVSYADCGNANPSSVAFVFDCDRDVGACAVLVAHETAHTFGLVHVTSGADIMTPAPADPELRFSTETLEAPLGVCGVTSQSSHAVLLAALGSSKNPSTSQ
jgi:hypothetical protein